MSRRSSGGVTCVESLGFLSFLPGNMGVLFAVSRRRSEREFSRWDLAERGVERQNESEPREWGGGLGCTEEEQQLLRSAKYEASGDGVLSCEQGTHAERSDAL